MVNKNLQQKIVEDEKLKLLLHKIRDDFNNKGKENSESLVEKIIDDNRYTIEEYLDKHIVCKSGNMSECKQKNPGYEDSLTYENGQFYPSVERCAHWKHDHKNDILRKQFSLIDYDLDEFDLTIPKYIEELKNDSDIFTQSEIKQRIKFFNLAKLKLDNRNRNNGIFLSGEPGVGKTTLMKVLANSIAEKQIDKIAFVTVPDFLYGIKEGFNKKGTKTESKIELMKKADILFLDDFGAENASKWSRDELLFPVLNYRMTNRKITFFTSNFSLEELRGVYLIKCDDKKVEQQGWKRFFERVRTLAEPFELKGTSHR